MPQNKNGSTLTGPTREYPALNLAVRKKKIRVYSLIISLVVVMLLLAGCWIPENFEANITINKDGSYTFTYNGTLTFAPVLQAAKEGIFSQEDEAIFAREAENFKRDPDYKQVQYLGKGRFKVLVKHLGKVGKQYDFLSREMKIFSITPQQDGSIEITTLLLKKEELNELKSIGAKVNGTLTVSVAKGVEIIKHNAQSKPMLFGLFGGYKWEITSIDAKPFILVQPSP